jgi:hypothetical protein
MLDRRKGKHNTETIVNFESNSKVWMLDRRKGKHNTETIVYFESIGIKILEIPICQKNAHVSKAQDK